MAWWIFAFFGGAVLISAAYVAGLNEGRRESFSALAALRARKYSDEDLRREIAAIGRKVAALFASAQERKP